MLCKNWSRIFAVFGLVWWLLAASPALSAEPTRKDTAVDAMPADFSKSIADAREAITREDFAAAQRNLHAARVAAETATDAIPADQRSELMATIAKTQLAVYRAFNENIRETTPHLVESCTLRPEEPSPVQRRRTIELLSKTSRVLIFRGEIARARGVLRQINTIDPSNRYARTALWIFNPQVWSIAILLCAVCILYAAVSLIRHRRVRFSGRGNPW